MKYFRNLEQLFISTNLHIYTPGISYYWIEKYDSSISSLTRAIKIMKKDPTAIFIFEHHTKV